MNHEKLTGVANIAYSTILLITGILFYILFPVKEIGSNYSILVNSSGWIPINMITMIATALGILGAVGMYMKQVEKSKYLSLIGFIFIIFSLIMKACAISWEFAIWPAILQNNPANTLLTESLIYNNAYILSFYAVFTLLFMIGYIVFGIGSLKAKVFPKWAAILLIIGAPAYAILLSIPPFGLPGLALYCVSLFGYGFSLINKQSGGDK
jgi:hypothetical protein